MKVFIILVSVFCVSQATDEYRKYIEQAIDPNVKACDNFYRHACRNTTTSNLFSAFAESIELAVDMHANTGSPTIDKFLDVIRYFTRYSSNEQFQSESQQQYLQNCAKKTLEPFLEEYIQFIPTASECIRNISKQSGCFDESETFKRCVEVFDVPTLQNTLTNPIEGFLFANWINQHGSYGLQRMSENLDKIKATANKLIEETPWLKHYGEIRLFENYTSATIFEDYVSMMKEKIGTVQKLSEIYENCSTNSVLRDAAQHAACFSKIGLNSDLLYELYEISLMNGDNAGNTNGLLSFEFAYFYVSQFIENPAEYMAFAGFTIAHEAGHSIVHNTNSPVKYSEIVRSCIQNQFNKSCEYFREVDCEVKDTQIGDSGSDLIGFEIIFEHFKKQMAGKLHEQVPKYTIPMTYEQLFFYAYTAQWCRPGPSRLGDDEHQAAALRTNAVVIQHDEFRKAFDCSDQSRMVEANNGKCNIFGPDAPQTKSRKGF